VPWNLYLPHREFLERFDADILVDERDKDAYSDAFTRLSEAYLRELEPQQAMVRICCVSMRGVFSVNGPALSAFFLNSFEF
jgi:hypothetical protein